MTPDTDIDRHVERFRHEIDAYELARLSHPSSYRNVEIDGGGIGLCPAILLATIVSVGFWAGVVLGITKLFRHYM